MSYRGAISFEHLRQSIDAGFRPRVRVFLQEIGLDGRSGSQVREVHGFSAVNISRSINARGSASITFSNLDDRLFQGRADGANGRKYSSENKAGTRIAITQLLNKALPYVKELNPLRRPAGQDRAFQGPGAFTGDRLTSYLDYVYNFTCDTGVKLITGALKGVGSQFVDLITLGLLQRVYIDIQGQDGLWYAGFSGLVSSITDDYIPGEMPTVTLRCSDLWRLFDLTEIIVKQGPGLDNPSDISKTIRDTIFFEVQEKLGLTNNDFRASVFDSTPGPTIVYQILRLTQNALCYLPNLLSSNTKGPGSLILNEDNLNDLISGFGFKEIPLTQNDAVVQARKQFFFDDPFWVLPKQSDLKANYEGVTTLRRVHSGILYTRAINTDGTDKRDDAGFKSDKLLFIVPKSSDGKSTRKEGEGIQDGDYVGTLTGFYNLDRFTDSGLQGIVYQELIKNIIGPWQVQQATGSTVLKKVADATFYDMYCNGNGDFVYQVPRYNNHPGEFNINVSTPQIKLFDLNPVVTAPTEQEAANRFSTDVVVDYGDMKQSGLYDYSPGPRRFPTKFHGLNYAITDLGLRGWSYMRSEEPIITVMRVPGGSNLIQEDQKLQSIAVTGHTDLELTRDLQQRFGVRARTSQQIFLPNLYASNPNATKLLSKFAFGLMQQFNGLSDGGTVRLHSRPDLELGNNISVVERQKLYYITGLTYSYVEGQDVSTSLQLAYGHDWAVEIPNPWALIDATQLVSPVTVSGGSASGLAPKPADQLSRPAFTDPGKSEIWKGWVWPVPTLSKRGIAAIPEVSNGFRPPAHYGVDTFYRRLAGEPGVPHNGAGVAKGAYRTEVGLAEGTRVKGYFNPNNVPVYASGPGVIWSVLFDPTYGWNIVIDHHVVKGFGKVATFYQHLAVEPIVKPKQRVEAGQQIGIMGRDPVGADALVHLHFEIWHMQTSLPFDRSRDAVDPSPILNLWGRIVNPDKFNEFVIAPGFSP